MSMPATAADPIPETILRARLTHLAWAVSILCMGATAHADETSELRAQIEAQRAAQAAQASKLEDLERKLAALQQAQPAPAPVGSSTAVYTPGAGLNVDTPIAKLTLYGLIDLTYVGQTHADSAGHTLVSPRVAWFSGNKWGLAGRRSLGATGLDVTFKLESEFESQTGNFDTPGVIFNRDAWVGIESKELGKLTFGRQNAIGRDFSGIYGDPYTSAAPSTEEGGWTNNNNYKQMIFYAGSATGTRIDNGVVWKKKFDSGLVAGLQYQFGGVPGQFSQGTTETAALGYAGGKLNLAGYATTAKVAGNTDTSYSFGGNYLVGPVRLYAGYFHYRGEQGALGDRRDDGYTASAKYMPAGPFDYELGYQVMRARNAAVNGAGNILNAFRDVTAATATASGNRPTVYGSVFYHFDRISEIYLAMDYTKVNGGYTYAPLNGFRSQTELGVGFRTRF